MGDTMKEEPVKILVRFVNIDNWLFSDDFEPQIGDTHEAMQHQYDPELYWVYFATKDGALDRRGIYKWRVVQVDSYRPTGWDTP